MCVVMVSMAYESGSEARVLSVTFVQRTNVMLAYISVRVNIYAIRLFSLTITASSHIL